MLTGFLPVIMWPQSLHLWFMNLRNIISSTVVDGRHLIFHCTEFLSLKVLWNILSWWMAESDFSLRGQRKVTKRKAALCCIPAGFSVLLILCGGLSTGHPCPGERRAASMPRPCGPFPQRTPVLGATRRDGKLRNWNLWFYSSRHPSLSTAGILR